jgi:hypothetical protein
MIGRWAFWFVALTTLVALCSVPVLADEEEGPELDDIMEEMQEALELTEEQQPEVEKAMLAYMTSLNETQAKYEEMEEPDPQAMLGEFKKIRDDYYKNLQKILSKEQWQTYEAMREEILHEIFSEIAALRIIDLKEPLSLTDEQADAMKPVMGKSLRDFVGTIFEYGDKKMTIRNKLKIANSLKSTKAATETELKKILSEEQWAKWQAMKEEQKG